MFCNINFRLLHKNQLFIIEDQLPKCIATVNAQFIVLGNNDKRFMNILNTFYSSFDGEVPLKFAHIFREYRTAESIKGSEIIYDFIEYAKENNLKIFLLGGKQSSNEISIKLINEQYSVNAEGYSPEFEDYPFSERFVTNCMARISAFAPDILFVGFGAPKQEFFIEDNLEEFKKIGVKYIIGSGGTFEFLSGNIKRAPKWISKAGLEGIYRFTQETNMKRFLRILYSFRFFKYIYHKPEFK